ncbi:unnamed protein product [Rotaria sordida]|uniref:G-protein coupled receptors family 1 profile domain-containing protein n=1 Tax=Rotaria sordida TaxID=392033 RepID=A0A814JN44_9BILA|nr:unnamed protein product [Rotaria sordida]CAF3673325.1 unnamed protein product [Rotaria sordida]
MTFENHSIIINIESWFIPFDILMIMSTALAIVLALIFLLTIILDKTCHTVPMMLVANSCLAEFIFGSDMLGMALFTFQNDFHQNYYPDSLCIFRGYLGYIVTILQNYSYLLQAIYRYIIIIYPTHLFWQSVRFQVCLILTTWIFGFVCPLPYILNNEIKYNINNQICQMPLQLSFLTIYNALCVYVIPISLTMLIYFKLVRYVQDMRKHITPINILYRAQRELKMFRRLVILVMGIAMIGFPYALFIFISFFTIPPKYHFRIAYIFVDTSMAFVMIALFQFTEPLKTSIMKRVTRQANR